MEMRRRALGTAYAWADRPGHPCESSHREGSQGRERDGGSRTMVGKGLGACGRGGRATRTSDGAAGVVGRGGNRWTRGSVRRGAAEGGRHGGGGEGRKGAGARRAAAFFDVQRTRDEQVGMHGEQHGGNSRARQLSEPSSLSNHGAPPYNGIVAVREYPGSVSWRRGVCRLDEQPNGITSRRARS